MERRQIQYNYNSVNNVWWYSMIHSIGMAWHGCDIHEAFEVKRIEPCASSPLSLSYIVSP